MQTFWESSTSIKFNFSYCWLTKYSNTIRYFTPYNLNLLLKLHVCPIVITSNNLPLKTYLLRCYENIMNIVFLTIFWFKPKFWRYQILFLMGSHFYLGCSKSFLGWSNFFPILILIFF